MKKKRNHIDLSKVQTYLKGKNHDREDVHVCTKEAEKKSRQFDLIQGSKQDEEYRFIYYAQKRARFVSLFANFKKPFVEFIKIGASVAVFLLLIGFSLHIHDTFEQVDAFEETMTQDMRSNAPLLLLQQEYAKVDEMFQHARATLKDIEKDFPRIPDTSLVDDTYFRTLQSFLEASEHVLEAGESLTHVFQNVKHFWQDYQELVEEDLKKRYGSLSTFLKFQWKYLQEHGVSSLQKARDSLNAINKTLLPPQFASKIEEVTGLLGHVLDISEQVSFIFPRVLSLVGDDFPRTYVVLLQNSSESRATGGFIGSLAFIKLNDGWIEKVYFKDVYDFDGQFFEDITPPRGLQGLTHEFRLRDANYWPDFPTSAKQVAWFLDKEKGPGVDGVFAITDTVIQDLLRILGPIHVDGINTPITHENFTTMLSFIVEKKVNRSQPKQILFDVGDIFMAKVKGKILRSPELLSSVLNSIEEKKVLAYSFHKPIQELFEYLQLDGKIYRPPVEENSEIQDYLMVVHTSIGANKSDKYMTQSMKHTTKVLQDGGVVDTLKIHRAHTWDTETEQSINDLMWSALGTKLNSTLRHILGGSKNVTYTRVYVPEGSELIASTGIHMEDIETYEELGKTVFAYTDAINPGYGQEIELTYKLARTSDTKGLVYYFTAEKQPGAKNYTFKKSTLMAEGVSAKNILPDISISLTSDMHVGNVFYTE